MSVARRDRQVVPDRPIHEKIIRAIEYIIEGERADAGNQADKGAQDEKTRDPSRVPVGPDTAKLAHSGLRGDDVDQFAGDDDDFLHGFSRQMFFHAIIGEGEFLQICG